MVLVNEKLEANSLKRNPSHYSWKKKEILIVRAYHKRACVAHM